MAATAWVASAEDDRERAVKLMRAAADGEDGSLKHVAMENRLYPMRELLADLLLELDRPADALKEYEAALAANPNRYRGFWGAARAANKAGDRQKATAYFAKLVELSKKADTERPEIKVAKTFLERE
jgi:tetratricopeptide (TPR) repeat protein